MNYIEQLMKDNGIVVNEKFAIMNRYNACIAKVFIDESYKMFYEDEDMGKDNAILKLLQGSYTIKKIFLPFRPEIGELYHFYCLGDKRVYQYWNDNKTTDLFIIKNNFAYRTKEEAEDPKNIQKMKNYFGELLEEEKLPMPFQEDNDYETDMADALTYAVRNIINPMQERYIDKINKDGIVVYVLKEDYLLFGKYLDKHNKTWKNGTRYIYNTPSIMKSCHVDGICYDVKNGVVGPNSDYASAMNPSYKILTFNPQDIQIEMEGIWNRVEEAEKYERLHLNADLMVVYTTLETEMVNDNARFNAGNYNRSKELLQNKADMFNLTMEMFAWAGRNGNKINKYNLDNLYYLNYIISENVIFVAYVYKKTFSFLNPLIVHFHSKELAQKALDIFGDRLKAIWEKSIELAERGIY